MKNKTYQKTGLLKTLPISMKNDLSKRAFFDSKLLISLI